MKKFSKYIEEMSMSVTLKPKKNNMYKVTGVGKKMAAHGGIKKGEKFHDRDIDGMHDSGIKVKYEKPKPMMKKEAIERRADRKTIIATDPATGRKVVKIAPKKEIDIGKGKMESVVNEISDTMKINYINKAKKQVTDLEKAGVSASGKYNTDAGNENLKRRKGIRMATGKLGEANIYTGTGTGKKSYESDGGMQKANKAAAAKSKKEMAKKMAAKIAHRKKYGDPMKLAKGTSDYSGNKGKRAIKKRMLDFPVKEENIQELDTKTLANYQRKAGAQYKQAKVDSDERTAYKPFSVKGGRASDAAEKLKNKRGKGLAQSKKVLDKRYSDKQVKMGKGVAFDKRYKGGNMTGASKAINKIKKGLADHPKVANALRRANEEYKKGE